MFEAIPAHHTLSLLLTFGCTAACKHCGTFSNPGAHTSLDRDLMLSAIDQAVESGYLVVVFTGGEPTLRLAELLCAIERASSAGLVTRVVTNAWWAADGNAAFEMAASLVAAGLAEINFSTGDEHARYVPVENILRACLGACKAGFRTICVMVETVRGRSVTAATLTDSPAFKDMVGQFPDARIHVLESPWMPTSPSNHAAYPDGMAANRDNLARRGGCNSCLTTTTVQADGRISACCGLGIRSVPELQVGHIRTTTLRQADEEAANDFLKRWIRVEGPERILAWAATHDERIEWENLYAHRCQACLRLYKDERVRNVIRQRHTEKLADVLLAEWLLFRYDARVAEEA
ncbi:radical SAM family protein [Roseiarcus fermentans]|uniref:Radical SAM family protein n=2 Tax=Roseiarcus fermentans TaxID=1473586 RepID=A0A366FBU3_9HYPH|nr:radical SAM family protein [Roseiarcus fermentans]